jgi:hypothetical protein
VNTTTTVTESLDVQLANLQDEYTYRINMLLEEDRTDLATKLADRYVEDAAALMAAAAR